MNELIGGCKCGQIQYRVDGPALQVVACHCGMCRAMTGAAFSAYVVVREDQFSVRQGRESMARYAVTERTHRHFCATCGTPLFNSNPETYAGLTMLYLGTVAGHAQLAPRVDIFCEDKLPWVSVHAASKSFPRAPHRS